MKKRILPVLLILVFSGCEPDIDLVAEMQGVWLIGTDCPGVSTDVLDMDPAAEAENQYDNYAGTNWVGGGEMHVSDYEIISHNHLVSRYGENHYYRKSAYPLNVTPVIADGTWIDLTVAAGDVICLSFQGSAGASYAIQWDEASGGSGTCTAEVKVSAFASDMSTAYFDDQDAGYATPPQITVTEAGTVYIDIKGYTSDDSGSARILIVQL